MMRAARKRTEEAEPGVTSCRALRCGRRSRRVARRRVGLGLSTAGRARGARRLGDPKALVLDLLSLGFRGRAKRRGIATNPAFAGAYQFTPTADFARVFPRFLTGLPDGGLIMCHPGFVDAELKELDPLTTLREHEFAFFDSEAFPQVLAAHGAELAR